MRVKLLRDAKTTTDAIPSSHVIQVEILARENCRSSPSLQSNAEAEQVCVQLNHHTRDNHGPLVLVAADDCPASLCATTTGMHPLLFLHDHAVNLLNTDFENSTDNDNNDNVTLQIQQCNNVPSYILCDGHPPSNLQPSPTRLPQTAESAPTSFPGTGQSAADERRVLEDGYYEAQEAELG